MFFYIVGCKSVKKCKNIMCLHFSMEVYDFVAQATQMLPDAPRCPQMPPDAPRW